MVKTILKQVKQYKAASILTVILTAFEVVLELIIPMLMASVDDHPYLCARSDQPDLHPLYGSHDQRQDQHRVRGGDRVSGGGAHLYHGPHDAAVHQSVREI